MVEEIGPWARLKFFSDKIKAFVSYRPRHDGKSWQYTIHKASHFVPFNVEKLFIVLNDMEGSADDYWGGGELGGGSSFIKGSKIPPDKLSEIINNNL